MEMMHNLNSAQLQLALESASRHVSLARNLVPVLILHLSHKCGWDLSNVMHLLWYTGHRLQKN